jgi:hypothetical protein
MVGAAQPRLLVELGTYTGVSYTAFCQSVMNAGFDTRCVAVDTWLGDKQSSIYGEEVYSELREFHDGRYGAFSTLLRCTFDDALACFSDGSVDVLHIDGLHTYDAVRHDFDAWFPKLSNRAVVLLHDTNEYQADFGVWRLWAEISKRFSCFEFLHSHGLGVLATGSNVTPAIAELCGLRDPADIVRVRERFAFLGERWIADLHQRQLRAEANAEGGAAADVQARTEAAYHELQAEQARAATELDELRRQLETERATAATGLDDLRQQLEVERAGAEAKVAELAQELEQQRAEYAALERSNERAERACAFVRQQLGDCRQQLAECRQQLAECRPQLAECHQQLAECHQQLAESRQQLVVCRELARQKEREIAALHTSNSWRLTAPLRAISMAIRPGRS